MLNKKLFVITSLIASIISASAFAKTEGNYVGLNLIQTSGKQKALDSDALHRDENISMGVDYKHAFNFGGLFVAPGIFYDHNALNSDVSSGTGDGTRQSDNLRYSYGVKVNVGYDVTDKFAPFITLGHMQTRNTASIYDGATYDQSKVDSTNEAFLFGVGMKYSLCDKVDVNLSYESAQYGLSKNLIEVARGTDKINPSFNVIRLGATYNF